MKRKVKVISTLLLIAGLVFGWNIQNNNTAEALIGANALVSKNSSGTKGNSNSEMSDISLDGRYVVFQSQASNLVSGDTNNLYDIFLKDTMTNIVTRVSVDSSGSQSNGHSQDPKISGDGNFIVYMSGATNLVPNDTNGHADIFRYNTTTGITELVSVDESNNQADNGSGYPVVDTEGRFIAFITTSTNLSSVVDTNSVYDVVLKDMATGSATYLSQSDSGVLSNGQSSLPKISCDGRYIAFSSSATNLVSGDTNGKTDGFITDMLGTRTVANFTLSANQNTYVNDISCDGRYVLYTTTSSNEISGDTNGKSDAFRYNRTNGLKDRVSIHENGSAPINDSSGAALSADGRYAIFQSTRSNFFTNSTDNNSNNFVNNDLFIRDMQASSMRVLVVKADLQNPTAGTGSVAAFSGTNRVVYDTLGPLLVSNDTDNYYDVYTVDLGPAGTCIVE